MRHLLGTLRMTVNSPERWEVEQDDFGRPMVRHRHFSGTVPAYVSIDAEGGEFARCPDCGERYRLRGKDHERHRFGG